MPQKEQPTPACGNCLDTGIRNDGTLCTCLAGKRKGGLLPLGEWRRERPTSDEVRNGAAVWFRRHVGDTPQRMSVAVSMRCRVLGCEGFKGGEWCVFVPPK